MNEYRLGTSVRVQGVFKNIAGAAFDPDSVICLIKDPAGDETAYEYGVDDELVKASTGTYYLWLLPTLPGRHVYRLKGIGDQSVANEQTFTVSRSAFATP